MIPTVLQDASTLRIEVSTVSGEVLTSIEALVGTTGRELKQMIAESICGGSYEQCLVVEDGSLIENDTVIPSSPFIQHVQLVSRPLLGRDAFPPIGCMNDDPSEYEYCRYAAEMMESHGGYVGARVRFVATKEHCHVTAGMQGLILNFDSLSSFAVIFHIVEHTSVWVSMAQCELLETSDGGHLLPNCEVRHPDDVLVGSPVKRAPTATTSEDGPSVG